MRVSGSRMAVPMSPIILSFLLVTSEVTRLRSYCLASLPSSKPYIFSISTYRNFNENSDVLQSKRRKNNVMFLYTFLHCIDIKSGGISFLRGSRPKKFFFSISSLPTLLTSASYSAFTSREMASVSSEIRRIIQ